MSASRFAPVTPARGTYYPEVCRVAPRLAKIFDGPVARNRREPAAEMRPHSERRPPSCFIAETKTSCTRSSASAGRHARQQDARGPCARTLTYNSPNAARSPPPAACDDLSPLRWACFSRAPSGGLFYLPSSIAWTSAAVEWGLQIRLDLVLGPRPPGRRSRAWLVPTWASFLAGQSR